MNNTNTSVNHTPTFIDEGRAQLSLAWYVYLHELRRLFSYRADFWMSFVGNLAANLVVAFALFTALFAEQALPTIAGFDKEAMLVYYLVAPLVENMTRLSARNGSVAHEIYRGSLTRYLVYPTSYFMYRTSQVLASLTLSILQFLAVFLAYMAFFANTPLTFAVIPSLGLGIMACLGATLLNLALVSLIEMVAFWAEQVWTLSVMLMFAARLLGGMMLPLSFFSQEAQSLLKILPFSYLISFPTLSILGRVNLSEWLHSMLILTIWLGVASFIARHIWRRGLEQYSGAGQ